MKGRPKTIRKISFMPAVSGFRPYGDTVDKTKKACVFLLYEEYEALRLNDYEKHSQCESAAIMQISRPTFTRIYMSAREKIAKAFVEGLRIVIEGGKVELDGDWYVCKKCKAIFSRENDEEMVCALCGSSEIFPYELPVCESVSETTVVSAKVSSDNIGSMEGVRPVTGKLMEGCRKPCCRKRKGMNTQQDNNNE